MEQKRKLLIVQEGWKRNEESLKHQVEHPLYEECYKVGLKSIFRKAAEENRWLEENQNRVIVDERSNILTFIGKRGSGKTTAMDEFCRILKSFDKEEEYQWWLKSVLTGDIQGELEHAEFHFHILNPIDASLFGETEDLFEQIIANIYRYFKKKVDADGKVLAKISDVMKCYYSNVDESGENRHSSFSIVNMMNFASDNNALQQKIAALIDELLDRSGRREYEYIVITIDDIDLNLCHGYQMLEQIQKYFAYHKIIILISMDYDQMRLLCEEHFSSKMHIAGELDAQNFGTEYVRNLAKDVMMKLFHLSQRIYMPDFSRILKSSYIVVPSENEEDLKISIKEYTLGKIAGYMHVYYDMYGSKQHFAEPTTIRELIVYNEFLDSLESIPYGKLTCMLDFKDDEGENNKKKINDEILKSYDNNYRMFMDDIIDRMAQNTLTLVQRDAFYKWITRDINKRAIYFMNAHRENDRIIFGDTDEIVEVKTSKLGRLSNEYVKESDYTYGALLEHIYNWGRSFDSDCFEDKPFIWCILASLTVEMTRTYIHYRYNTDQQRRQDKYRKRLFSFIGNSMGNQWLSYAFPKIKTSNKKVVSNLGYRELTLAEQMVIPIQEEEFRNIGCWEEFTKYLEKIKLIKIMEMLSFCFAGISGESIEILEFKFISREEDMKGSEDGKSGRANQSHITAKTNSKIKLDMMSFVIKSLDYNGTYLALVDNIVSVLKDIVEKCCGEFRMSGNEVREFVVRELYVQETPVEAPEVAFPFYDLDLSYNICKRLRRKFKDEIASDGLYNAMQTYYHEIDSLLEKEQQSFSKVVRKKYPQYYIPYRSYYKNDPYIAKILSGDIDGEVINKVENIIIGMISKKDDEAEVG